MSTNSGPVIPCMSGAITAAITHSKRVNGDNDTEDNLITYTKTEPRDCKNVSSPKEILEELKKVLEQEKCKDENSISIYDVLILTRKKYEEWKSIERRLRWHIEAMTDNESLYLDVDYDCKNKQLIISYHCNDAFFYKKDGDLIILKSAWYGAKDVLGKCGDEISKCYDKFIEDISFHRDYMKNIKSSNSNFIINTDRYGIYLSERNKLSSEFELFGRIFENEYRYDCNLNNITSICRNNEDEIFKRVFVNIEDCPEWMRMALYEIRKNRLIKEQKIEEKLRKKTKKIGINKKNFAFSKKII